VKIAVSLLLVGFILARIGPEKIFGQLRAAQPLWGIGALALFTASHFLGSFQWCLLMRSEGMNIPWRTTLSFYFTGLFFNNFFISSMGGDIFRIMDARRYSRDGAGAVSTVFLDRFMGLFVLSGLALIGAPWILHNADVRAVIQVPLLILLAGWILFLPLLFYRPFARPFAWIIVRMIPARLSVRFRSIYRRIHAFGKRKKMFFLVIGLSLLIQSARIFTHFLLSRSLGAATPLSAFFLIVPVIAVLASLPISLGGLGLRENAGVLLFGVVGGMTASQAFSTEFSAYLVAILSSIPGGVIFASRRGSSAVTKIKDLQFTDKGVES
jgi:uncharacterized protein (TIRG00374 family)